MEKSRRTKGGDLPEELIQHIRSFMGCKQAAQSSIVSKSWYNEWSTRPNLIFDTSGFGIDEQGFWEFANKTIQRYETLNLKIESFSLRALQYLDSRLAIELIAKAIKMGAVDFNLILATQVLGSDTLVTLSLNGCKIDSRKVSGSLIEKLSLGNVVIDTSFFGNLSVNFPFLKDLCLDHCSTDDRNQLDDRIRLSSRSLECITLKHHYRALRATFDAPNIRTFKCYSSCWPDLFFKTASREWKSYISLYSVQSFNTAYLLKINKLLTSLSSSKISLSLGIWPRAGESVDFKGLGLPETAVENLTIRASPCSLFMVLECLFWSCRPKFVTLQLLPCEPSKLENTGFLETLRQRNIDGVRVYSLMMMNNELEEVDVQLIEPSSERPLPKEIQLQLRWRGSNFIHA